MRIFRSRKGSSNCFVMNIADMPYLLTMQREIAITLLHPLLCIAYFFTRFKGGLKYPLLTAIEHTGSRMEHFEPIPLENATILLMWLVLLCIQKSRYFFLLPSCTIRSAVEGNVTTAWHDNWPGPTHISKDDATQPPVYSFNSHCNSQYSDNICYVRNEVILPKLLRPGSCEPL